MILVDGSLGEGGGQVLRTALALSLATGEPFRIQRIRARRPRPGLGRQHLTAVQAAAEVGEAEVEGAALGSTTLTFRPRRLRGGDFSWEVGTAGSVGLVLQAVLPALLVASHASRLKLSGGTHNPQAPPYEFLSLVLFPFLRRMGVAVEGKLEAYGFYPAGGGRVQVEVRPADKLLPVVAEQRGEVRRCSALALLARLPRKVGERELAVVRRELGWEEGAVVEVESPGPGNALLLMVEGEEFAEVVTGFGTKGVPAEQVAEGACDAMGRFLAASVPVGEHLADQLLVPLALAGGGRFRTLPLSLHTRTVIEVVRAFLPVEVMVSAHPDGSEVVELVTGGVA
ncbi:MAG: RNA 3'-terminal phosphate cyclase [Thermoanaerobaculum sp.]|nr:RNA 3'-terminal phosphate cyclase [Thermoanaerobaculum sp.]